MEDRNYEFKTIFTITGMRKLLESITSKEQLVITDFGVGDGGGLPVEVSPEQTSLVNERYKNSIIDYKIVDETQVNITGIVPPAVGGFDIVEIGIYDEDGDLIAVGNCPPTYKPLIDEGALKDLRMDIILRVDNVDDVVIEINPYLAAATIEDLNELRSELAKEMQGLENEYEKDKIEQEEKIEQKFEDFYVEFEGEKAQLIEDITEMAEKMIVDLVAEGLEEGIADIKAEIDGYLEEKTSDLASKEELEEVYNELIELIEEGGGSGGKVEPVIYNKLEEGETGEIFALSNVMASENVLFEVEAGPETEAEIKDKGVFTKFLDWGSFSSAGFGMPGGVFKIKADGGGEIVVSRGPDLVHENIKIQVRAKTSAGQGIFELEPFGRVKIDVPLTGKEEEIELEIFFYRTEGKPSSVIREIQLIYNPLITRQKEGLFYKNSEEVDIITTGQDLEQKVNSNLKLNYSYNKIGDFSTLPIHVRNKSLEDVVRDIYAPGNAITFKVGRDIDIIEKEINRPITPLEKEDIKIHIRDKDTGELVDVYRFDFEELWFGRYYYINANFIQEVDQEKNDVFIHYPHLWFKIIDKKGVGNIVRIEYNNRPFEGAYPLTYMMDKGFHMLSWQIWNLLVFLYIIENMEEGANSLKDKMSDIVEYIRDYNSSAHYPGELTYNELEQTLVYNMGGENPGFLGLEAMVGNYPSFVKGIKIVDNKNIILNYSRGSYREVRLPDFFKLAGGQNEFTSVFDLSSSFLLSGLNDLEKRLALPFLMYEGPSLNIKGTTPNSYYMNTSGGAILVGGAFRGAEDYVGINSMVVGPGLFTTKGGVDPSVASNQTSTRLVYIDEHGVDVGVFESVDPNELRSIPSFEGRMEKITFYDFLRLDKEKEAKRQKALLGKEE